jgi:hypothetical protein
VKKINEKNEKRKKWARITRRSFFKICDIDLEELKKKKGNLNIEAYIFE